MYETLFIGIHYLSTGAWFLPSTVPRVLLGLWWLCFKTKTTRTWIPTKTLPWTSLEPNQPTNYPSKPTNQLSKQTNKQTNKPIAASNKKRQSPKHLPQKKWISQMIKSVLLEMASNKLNILHWHLTDDSRPAHGNEHGIAGKSTMSEDVFPIENGKIPKCHVMLVFRAVYHQAEGSHDFCFLLR